MGVENLRVDKLKQKGRGVGGEGGETGGEGETRRNLRKKDRKKINNSDFRLYMNCYTTAADLGKLNELLYALRDTIAIVSW